MRLLERLDAWGRSVDGKYEAWLERHGAPVVDTLIDLWPTIALIALGYALALGLSPR